MLDAAHPEFRLHYHRIVGFIDSHVVQHIPATEDGIKALYKDVTAYLEGLGYKRDEQVRDGIPNKLRK